MLVGVSAAACLLIAGCAGYTLGPTNGVSSGDKTVQITPFLNHTFQPRLGDAVTQSLREDFQNDATFRLVTHGTGDIIITGTIRSYSRGGIGYFVTVIVLQLVLGMLASIIVMWFSRHREFRAAPP